MTNFFKYLMFGALVFGGSSVATSANVIFQDFENPSSFSGNFTQSSNSSGSFAWSSSGGIGNSGKVNIPSTSDVIYTTNQSYTIEDNGEYTLTALFSSQYNSGYGSFGFTTAATSDASGSQGSPSEASLGVSFHAGGGSWMVNNSLTVLSWGAGGLDTDTSNAEWYLFELKIVDLTSGNFSMEFSIFDVDQTTGAKGSVRTTHTTTVTNASLKSANDLYVFFGAEGQRMIGFDNFNIALSSNVAVAGTQVGQTVADSVAPTLASSSPADDATSVGVADNIVLTFSEAVDAETGDIVIKKTSDDTSVETFDVTTEVTGSGTTTITINPTADLAGSTAYYVEIASTAFDDAAGNSYAGITGATTLNFETADVNAPTLASSSPSDDATGVTIDANIVLTFSEAVDAETGDIVIKRVSDNSVFETFSVASATAGSGTTTITINPSTDFAYSTAYYVEIASTAFDDAAGNSYGGISNSTMLNFTTVANETPALEFARHKAELTEIIQADALRSLRGSSASQQRLSRGARDRIMEASRQNSICDEDQRDVSVEQRIECDNSADNVALNVDGTAQFASGVLSAGGTFYELLGGIETDEQRLFYGDFDLQRDADGDTTASFNAKMAWEQQLNGASLWGYFVGGSFGNSDIGGTFEGSNDKVSLEAGLYGAHNFGRNLYADGYAAVGFGANNLELDNGVLVLDSNFTTRSFTTGMALSGVYTEGTFEVRPELAVNYGKTWISDVGFTGQAYGLTDGTLSLDAGSVELGTITLRPEFIIPLDQQSPSQSNTTLSISPRFMCEGTRQSSVSVDHCGSGAELGLGYRSDDGLGQADIGLMMDNIAGGTRSSWNARIELKF